MSAWDPHVGSKLAWGKLLDIVWRLGTGSVSWGGCGQESSILSCSEWDEDKQDATHRANWLH